MGDQPPTPIEPRELALYARVVAALAAGRPQDEVLAAVGLPEEELARLEQRVEDELSRAMAAPSEAPAPFLLAYERALREAHAATQPPAAELSLDRFVRALAALGSGRDPRQALEAMGLDPAAFARAASRHAARLATDPVLAARVAELLSSAGGSAPGSRVRGRSPR